MDCRATLPGPVNRFQTMFPALAKKPVESFWNMVCILGSARGFVCQSRAPHPAATGGGFGSGKFRRDEPPSFHFVAPRQRCLVQKLRNGIHLIRPADTLTHSRPLARPPAGFRLCQTPFAISQTAQVSPTRRRKLIRPVAALTRRCAPPCPIRWAGDIAQVKRRDGFSCRRFRFFLRNGVLHIQVPGF